MALTSDRDRVLDIPAGTCSFGASKYLSFAQLDPGIDCPPPQNFFDPWPVCHHALAQARTLANGEAMDGIDFDLRVNGANRGRVLRADTFAPIPGVAIDLWNAPGSRVGVALSDVNGEFAAPWIATGAVAGFPPRTDRPDLRQRLRLS